jgi:hypothetical protein
LHLSKRQKIRGRKYFDQNVKFIIALHYLSMVSHPDQGLTSKCMA